MPAATHLYGCLHCRAQSGVVGRRAIVVGRGSSFAVCCSSWSRAGWCGCISGGGGGGGSGGVLTLLGGFSTGVRHRHWLRSRRRQLAVVVVLVVFVVVSCWVVWVD